jgi:uncharacterized protein YjbI with pentapeptide repeats
MADKGQLEILGKGVKVWNAWRRRHPKVEPDLTGITSWELEREIGPGGRISRSKLSFREHEWKQKLEELVHRDLSGINLSNSGLENAVLSHLRLEKANFRGSIMGMACLEKSILRGANLFDAYLRGANFRAADLTDANLREANLIEADLRDAELGNADLSNTQMFGTVLGGNDFSRTKGLDSVRHSGPSLVGIDTVYLSKGNISEHFLRGAGVPDSFITYMQSLVVKPIEYYSCLISYSTKDQEFADLLHSQLQSKGARVWLATEDLKIGDKFRARIDEAIRLYDKLLLVLSKDSVKSQWVEAEVEAAFEKERKQKRTVLFPIRLDDAVMETEEAWAAEIRRIRHIGDFREWKNHDKHKEKLQRLLKDLKV